MVQEPGLLPCVFPRGHGLVVLCVEEMLCQLWCCFLLSVCLAGVVSPHDFGFLECWDEGPWLWRNWCFRGKCWRHTFSLGLVNSEKEKNGLIYYCLPACLPADWLTEWQTDWLTEWMNHGMNEWMVGFRGMTYSPVNLWLQRPALTSPEHISPAASWPSVALSCSWKIWAQEIWARSPLTCSRSGVLLFTATNLEPAMGKAYR